MILGLQRVFIVGLIVKVGSDLLFGAIRMCLPPAVVEEELRLRDLGRCSLLTPGIAGSLSALILAIILFYLVFPEFQSRSLASWTWAACNPENGVLHGRLVPLVFVWMLRVAWLRKKNEILRPSTWGLALLAIGLLFFLVAMRLGQPRLALLGLPFVVLGLVQFWFGLGIARAAILPALFLWFMIPLPGLEAIVTGSWQVKIMNASYVLGNLLGLDLTMSGAGLEMANGRFRIAEG